MVRWKKSKKDIADQMTLLCLLDILVYNLWTETNSAFYDNIEETTLHEVRERI